MKWNLHHVTLQTYDVDESNHFYREILGFEPGAPATIGSGTSKINLDGSTFKTLGDGNRGLHLARLIPHFAETAGLGLNPSLGGHVGIGVEDFDGMRRRLDDAGYFYTYAGDHAMRGVRQIYLFDPAGNVVELNTDH